MRRLLRELDSVEISEWMAFDQIEPIGPRRFDLLAGIITANTVNAVQNLPKGKTYKPADFMPDWDGSIRGEASKPQMTAQQMLFQVEYLNALFGGKDLRQKAVDEV